MKFLFSEAEAPDWCPKTMKEALPYQRRTYLVTAMVEELSRKAKFPRVRMNATPRATPRATPVPLLKKMGESKEDSKTFGVEEGSTSSAQVESNPVEAWLKERKLEKYWEQLLGDGFDDIDLIQEITEEDLDKWEFKKGHKIKMLKAIAQLKKK